VLFVSSLPCSNARIHAHPKPCAQSGKTCPSEQVPRAFLYVVIPNRAVCGRPEGPAVAFALRTAGILPALFSSRLCLLLRSAGLQPGIFLSLILTLSSRTALFADVLRDLLLPSLFVPPASCRRLFPLPLPFPCCSMPLDTDYHSINDPDGYCFPAESAKNAQIRTP
jgi:hypothetical protein